MDKHRQLHNWIASHKEAVGKVIDFDTNSDCLYRLDFTGNNNELTHADVADTQRFGDWVTGKLRQHNCRYGIGGYFELRTIYTRSRLFDTADEPRCLHLGTDIWGPTATTVFAPLSGRVHSFQDNNNFGDYGPTIILEHKLDELVLYSLYGHLSRESLSGLYIGKPFKQNELMAYFGSDIENGGWPPHLHFQLMFDMEGHKGDYPGVCRYSEKEQYRLNTPNPKLLLQFTLGDYDKDIAK